MDTESFTVALIEVGPRLRRLDPDKVDALAQSIAEVGLRTPISVRMTGPDLATPLLVAGLHRLEAVKRLGWEWMDCIVLDGTTELDAHLWEIAENLHRAELTVQERAEHVAEWIRLTEQRQRERAEAEAFSAQSARKSKRGRPEGGIAAASRDLGITRDEAARAQKIVALPDATKAAAVEVGLDDNQTALLAAAKADDPEAELRRIREEKDGAKVAKQISGRAPRKDRPAKADPPATPPAVLDKVASSMAAALAELPKPAAAPPIVLPAGSGEAASIEVALALLDRAEAAQKRRWGGPSPDEPGITKAEAKRRERARNQADTEGAREARECVAKAVAEMCRPIAERLQEMTQGGIDGHTLDDALLDIYHPDWRTDPAYGYVPPKDQAEAGEGEAA